MKIEGVVADIGLNLESAAFGSAVLRMGRSVPEIVCNRRGDEPLHVDVILVDLENGVVCRVPFGTRAILVDAKVVIGG